MTAAADFHALQIQAIAHEPGDALVITFAVPTGLIPTFAFKPGQFLTIRATIDGEELRRSYSICSGPSEPLRIAIKQVEGGRFSTWAHANLHVGANVDTMPPSGRFVLQASEGRPRSIIAIAAGSGITPILGIARQSLKHEVNTHLTLLYGNRSRDNIIFGEELEALKDTYLGRFDYVPIFSRHGEVDSPLFEGRIGADKIKALGATLIRFSDAERIFICGPGDMIKGCRDALMVLGVAHEAIMHEFFAPPSTTRNASRAKATAAGSSATTTSVGTPVTVILDGVRHRLAVAHGETVLQAALRAGVKAPYACSGGMCSTCRARIVEGTATMQLNYSLEPWEIAKGFTLACQAMPTSSSLTLDWDAM